MLLFISSVGWQMADDLIWRCISIHRTVCNFVQSCRDLTRVQRLKLFGNVDSIESFNCVLGGGGCFYSQPVAEVRQLPYIVTQITYRGHWLKEQWKGQMRGERGRKGERRGGTEERTERGTKKGNTVCLVHNRPTVDTKPQLLAVTVHVSSSDIKSFVYERRSRWRCIPKAVKCHSSCSMSVCVYLWAL